MPKIILSEKDRQELWDLYSKALKNGAASSQAWREIQTKTSSFGEKYGFDPKKTRIHPDTGEVTPLKPSFLRVYWMKIGCKFNGTCTLKRPLKSRRKGKGSRDSYHIYCSSEGTCNQQCFSAPKCDTPTVETRNP